MVLNECLDYFGCVGSSQQTICCLMKMTCSLQDKISHSLLSFLHHVPNYCFPFCGQEMLLPSCFSPALSYLSPYFLPLPPSDVYSGVLTDGLRQAGRLGTLWGTIFFASRSASSQANKWWGALKCEVHIKCMSCVCLTAHMSEFIFGGGVDAFQICAAEQ